jgi:hypothetical protein
MKNIYDRLNYYGGAWNSGGGGAAAATWGSITGTITDQTDLLAKFYKTNLPKTCGYENSSNTPLTVTLGTPLYSRLEEVTLDQQVNGYVFDVQGFTSAGDIEIALFAGTDTGNVTKVTNSSITYNITATGIKIVPVATPYLITTAQFSYYLGFLAITGTYTMLQSASFRTSSKLSFTGATGVSALPSTETTRTSANAALVAKLY